MLSYCWQRVSLSATDFLFRYIDPFFLRDGKLLMVSEADPDFAKRIERNRALNKGGIRLESLEGMKLPIEI